MIAGTEFYVAVDPATGMPERWSRPLASAATTSGLGAWPQLVDRARWRDVDERDWLGGDRGLGQWEWVGPTITGLLKGAEIWYTIDTQNRIKKQLEHDIERREAAELLELQAREAQTLELMQARQEQGLDPMTGEPVGLQAGSPADDTSGDGKTVAGMNTTTLLMIGGIGLAALLLMGGGGRRERRRERF